MCVHPPSTGWRSIHVCRKKAKRSGSALPSQMWWMILGIPPDAITTEVSPSSTARPDANGVCSYLRSRTCIQSLSLKDECRGSCNSCGGAWRVGVCVERDVSVRERVETASGRPMPLMTTPLRGHSLGRPHAPFHRTTVVAGCGRGERDSACRHHDGRHGSPACARDARRRRA